VSRDGQLPAPTLYLGCEECSETVTSLTVNRIAEIWNEAR